MGLHALRCILEKEEKIISLSFVDLHGLEMGAVDYLYFKTTEENP